MAKTKKELDPQPSPTGEGSPLDPQPSPTGEGSPLDPQPSPTGVEPEVRGSPLAPSENKVYQNIRTVLVTARQKVYSAINSAMVGAYWEIGRQIMAAQEGQRAEYGTGLIKYLAERLTKEFGKGFTPTNLKYMRQFIPHFQLVTHCVTN